MKIMNILAILSLLANADESAKVSMSTIQTSNSLTVSEAIVKDYKSFYSSERLMSLGIGFLAGGILANTQVDENIQNWYQDDIRSSNTDDFSNIAKQFGEGKYLIPIALLSAGLNFYDPELEIGVWGVYASRAYFIGAPVLIATQVSTGASRPNEQDYGSQWNPLNDNNGVSGHAFIGAVPFLTLAHMYEDNSIVKYLAYAGSLLTAWSRVNDNSHYFSQAALGWYLAYESVDAVFNADKKTKNLSVTPVLGRDSYGIQVQMKW